MGAFHSRGFLPGAFSSGDPLSLAGAFEAFIGLFIEVTFIATLTQGSSVNKIIRRSFSTHHLTDEEEEILFSQLIGLAFSRSASAQSIVAIQAFHYNQKIPDNYC